MESDLDDQALSLQSWIVEKNLRVPDNFAFPYAERGIDEAGRLAGEAFRNVFFAYAVYHICLGFGWMVDQGVFVYCVGWDVAFPDLRDKPFDLSVCVGSAGFLVLVVAEDPFSFLSFRGCFKSASGLELSDLVVFFSRLLAAVFLLLNGHQNSNQRTRRISDSAAPQLMICHNHTHVRDSAEAPDRRLRMHPPDQLSLSCSE